MTVLKKTRRHIEGSFLAKTISLTAAVLLLIIINIAPLERVTSGGSSLTMDGKAALSILVFVIVLWVTEAVPFAIAGLIGVLLIPVFGIETFTDVVGYGFGNSIVVFFIGVLAISSGLTRSGLADRLTSLILKKAGLSPNRLIFTFLVTGAFLSMWVTNMSVSAMLLPVGMNILRRFDAKPLKSNFGRALMIAIAWGPAIGGIGTPVGNGANIVTLSYLKDLAGVHIDFLRWMLVGVPAAILILPLAYLVLIRIFPFEPLKLSSDHESTNEDVPKLRATEIKALIIFAVTVLLWVGDPLIVRWTGCSLPLEAVAVGGAILFFMPGINILNWKEAQQDIDWGGIILIATGISMGMVIFNTGAAKWLAALTFAPLGGLSVALRIFVAVLIVEILKVFFSSNTVTGVILVPLIVALAVDLNLDPWMMAGPVAIATSLAFLLVTSSPTNVIPYASGYFTIRDFAKAGILITLLIPICVTIAFVVFGSIG